GAGVSSAYVDRFAVGRIRGNGIVISFPFGPRDRVAASGETTPRSLVALAMTRPRRGEPDRDPVELRVVRSVQHDVVQRGVGQREDRDRGTDPDRGGERFSGEETTHDRPPLESL